MSFEGGRIASREREGTRFEEKKKEEDEKEEKR